MKTKFFAKTIRTKFEDWLSTIDDQKVVSLVKDNTIITGGCIASMFLGDKISDFDVYFKNEETTEAVITYYVEKFKKIATELNPMSRDKLSGVEAYKHQRGGIRVKIPSAGIASIGGNDGYQFFETDALGLDTLQFLDNAMEAQKIALNDEIREKYGKYVPVFLSENAITLSDKMQLIGRFYGPVGEIHKNFDYEHTTNYWDSETGKLEINQEALESLLNKELRYVGSMYPLTSIVRMRKFIKRGWAISAGQILKMSFQLSKLDLTNIDVLREQLIGVDVAYFMQLIGILKKAKEEKGKDFNLDYTYLADLIDKMF